MYMCYTQSADGARRGAAAAYGRRSVGACRDARLWGAALKGMYSMYMCYTLRA